MTQADLSRGSGAAPQLIRRLVDLGIVPPRDGQRPFVAGDIHRVRLAQAFERSGIPLEAIGAAIASGRLSFAFVDEMFVDHPQLAPGSSARPPAGWPTGAWPSTAPTSRRRCSPRA